MTRGAGLLHCSGILLDAGPLVGDRGVQKAANEFRAAAALWPCGHIQGVLHGGLAFQHILDGGMCKMDGGGLERGTREATAGPQRRKPITICPGMLC